MPIHNPVSLLSAPLKCGSVLYYLRFVIHSLGFHRLVMIYYVLSVSLLLLNILINIFFKADPEGTGLFGRLKRTASSKPVLAVE